MPDPDEVCACPEEHYRTSRADGRCDQPPLWMDDAEDETLRKYTACGCCMADCPDVHAEQTMRPIGKATIAEEYVATLSTAEQDQLRAKAAAGLANHQPAIGNGAGPGQDQDSAQCDETA